MSKSKKRKADKEEILNDYYDLKSQAVEDLVSAQEGEAPVYSKEELERYRTRRKLFLPDWAKILLLKAWFAGSVCFFILWGLSIYVGAMLDMLVILAIVLGIVTDLLTNSLIRFMAPTEGAYDQWMMYPKKRYATFFLNILHSAVVLLCVYLTYNTVNYLILWATGAKDTIPLGVEPILFGVLCMGYDQLLIAAKHQLGRILSDAKNEAGRNLR